jgi:phenylacetate-CoA ligase
MSPLDQVPPNLLTRESLRKMIFQFRDVLMAREYLSPQEVADYRDTLLAKLIAHVAARVPYHADRLQPVLGDGPFSQERWRKIPRLTRAMLQRDAGRLHAQTLPFHFGTVGERGTSGSTGRPVDFREDDLHVVASEAQMDRAFTWWGLDGNKTHATFMSTFDARFRTGDQIRSEWRYGYPGGARHILELSVDIDEQIAWLAKVRPSYLSVRGGAHLAQLALRAERLGESLCFDLILSGACAMTAEARRLAERIFKSRVADIYGAAEAGIIAYECPDCGLHHTCDETIFVELLRDDGRPCEEGEIGRVVVTPLYNYAMSLIRYEIGDYATRGPACAPCGRGLSSLSSIVGRDRNLFVLRDGRVILPYIHNSLREHLSYRQVQMVQTTYDRVEIRYVPDADVPPDRPAIEALIHRVLDPGLAVTLVAIDRFEPNPGGKFEETLSLVPRDGAPGACGLP